MMPRHLEVGKRVYVERWNGKGEWRTVTAIEFDIGKGKKVCDLDDETWCYMYQIKYVESV